MHRSGSNPIDKVRQEAAERVVQAERLSAVMAIDETTGAKANVYAAAVENAWID